MQEWLWLQNCCTFRSCDTKVKAIGIPIGDTSKVLFFVKQMYTHGKFKEKEVTNYEIKPNNNKDWTNIFKYFTELLEYKKAHRKDRGGHSGHQSAAHTSDRTSLTTNRSATMGRSSDGSIAPACVDNKAWQDSNKYIKELEEFMAKAIEFVTNVSTT